VTQLTVRLLEPRDLPAIEAMFARVSDETIYRRFFTPGLGGPRHELGELSRVDGHDRAAVVAMAGDRAVGVARYHRAGTGHAEAAVIVEDACQHHGIGSRLMAGLTGVARREGVVAIDVSILGENSPALRLLHRLAPAQHPHLERGVFEATIPLAG
jgi:GNAT superfamily N-acetyltransferase